MFWNVRKTTQNISFDWQRKYSSREKESFWKHYRCDSKFEAFSVLKIQLANGYNFQELWASEQRKSFACLQRIEKLEWNLQKIIDTGLLMIRKEYCGAMNQSTIWIVLMAIWRYVDLSANVWTLNIQEELASIVMEKMQWFGVVFLIFVELNLSIEIMALWIDLFLLIMLRKRWVLLLITLWLFYGHFNRQRPETHV